MGSTLFGWCQFLNMACPSNPTQNYRITIFASLTYIVIQSGSSSEATMLRNRRDSTTAGVCAWRNRPLSNISVMGRGQPLSDQLRHKSCAISTEPATFSWLYNFGFLACLCNSGYILQLSGN